MNTSDVLAGLGMSSKEQAAYIALLELGEAPIADIAKKAGLKRPTAYLVLNRLGERGLVSEYKEGKRTYFVARDPAGLVSDAQLRLKELEAIVPQLETLRGSSSDKTRVVVYEGKDGADKAFDDWFITKGEAIFISSVDLNLSVFTKTFQRLSYKMTGPSFTFRELIEDTPHARDYARQYRSAHRAIRLLPPLFASFAMDLGVYGRRTVITSMGKDCVSVAIDSREVADSFRHIFESLWTISCE